MLIVFKANSYYIQHEREQVMGSSEWIAVIANIATAVGVFFAAFSYYFDNRRTRKQLTISAYNQLQETTLNKINLLLPSEIKDIVQDKTSEEYKELGTYLANIENFCLGINEKIYDFDIFFKLSHGYFDSERGILMPRLLPIIESKSVNSSEDYFQNLHIVWKRMGKKHF